MNTTVTASNMQVRAKAEKGLLINEVATAGDENWDDDATANQNSNNPVLLFPTSTSDGSTWYHQSSKKSNDSASAAQGAASENKTGAYETLSNLVNITSMTVAASAGQTAARETLGKTATSEAGYYVHYTYYLKSSGEAITLGTESGNQNIKIQSVVATPGASNSSDLNKSLRVGIKLNSEFYIYAPIAGFTTPYYVNASSTGTTPKAGDVATPTDLATLPASNANGAPVHVYVWYEGEDANCKTDNATAATLDNINIQITFALDTIA